jgi:hypothetical protein
VVCAKILKELAAKMLERQHNESQAPQK